MKPKNWILVWHHDQLGTLIRCRDKVWRQHADFGTFPECIKQFSSSNWALRAVRRLSGEYEAIAVVDSNGFVTETAKSLGIGDSF